LQSDYLSLDESIRVMKVLDKIKRASKLSWVFILVRREIIKYGQNKILY
jgi:hypothetical protein